MWIDFDASVPSDDELVSITIDGIEVFAVTFSSFQQGKRPDVYRLIDDNLVVRLNFKKNRMFVLRKNLEVTGLDNSNGVDVCLQMGIFSCDNIEMRAKRLTYMRPAQ